MRRSGSVLGSRRAGTLAPLLRPPGLRQRTTGLARTGSAPGLPPAQAQAGRATVLYLTPLEFLDRLAALIPPPRKHRHRYHGVLSPNAPLRRAVTAYAGLPLDTPGDSLPAQAATPPQPATGEPTPTRPARYLWAALIARIYAILPLICPECGDEMRLIAFMTEAEPLRRI